MNNQTHEIKNSKSKIYTSANEILVWHKIKLNNQVTELSNQTLTLCKLKKQVLTELFDRIWKDSRRQLNSTSKTLTNLWQAIKYQDPKNILANGYTYIQDMNDQFVKEKSSLRGNQLIKINFVNGEIQARVEKKHE